VMKREAGKVGGWTGNGKVAITTAQQRRKADVRCLGLGCLGGLPIHGSLGSLVIIGMPPSHDV
jgi:hypothetical protein